MRRPRIPRPGRASGEHGRRRAWSISLSPCSLSIPLSLSPPAGRGSMAPSPQAELCLPDA
eukprot:9467595-Prorocentrum_lima.AAC.1